MVDYPFWMVKPSLIYQASKLFGAPHFWWLENMGLSESGWGTLKQLLSEESLVKIHNSFFSLFFQTNLNNPQGILIVIPLQGSFRPSLHHHPLPTVPQFQPFQIFSTWGYQSFISQWIPIESRHLCCGFEPLVPESAGSSRPPHETPDITNLLWGCSTGCQQYRWYIAIYGGFLNGVVPHNPPKSPQIIHL